MVKQKEENDKRLLRMEILMVIVCILQLLISVLIVTFAESKISEEIASIIVLTSLIPILLVIPFAIRIEQTAGYYECQKCHT